MTERLPAAPWTQREDLAAMVAALGSDNVQWVGGAVRDTILGVNVQDIDAATPLKPEEVIERLNAAGIRTIPTGIDHGTVTALMPAEGYSGNVEITTLRHDLSTDGRRATVAFAQDWRQDAARRDFTINALFADPRTLEVTDYFGGEDDLAVRLVRFIGDADARILEDHLRILRYFRFHARFGGTPDPGALEACARHADRLKALSRERIARELLLLLGGASPLGTARLMDETGIWRVILPEMASDGLATLETLLARELLVDAPADPLLRLAALLPVDAQIAETLAARLRLSKAQRTTLARYATPWPGTGLARQVAATVQPAEIVAPWLLLRGPSDALETGWQSLRGWTVPDFPLGGRDILALGVHAGPDVARVLGETRRRWIAEGFPDSARIRAIATEVAGR